MNTDSVLTLGELVAVQVGAIIAYIGTVFLLYRLLVSQKDATIETLKEANGFLRQRLEAAQASAPDALATRLSTRIALLNEELERLGTDHERNRATISEKEMALKEVLLERSRLKEQLARAQDVLGDLTCPLCGSSLAERRLVYESMHANGREFDVEREFIAYECGLTFLDGAESQPCGRSP